MGPAWNAAFLPSRDLGEGLAATFEKRPAELHRGIGVQPNSAFALALDSGSHVVPNAVAG